MKAFKTLCIALGIALPMAANANLPKFMLNETPIPNYHKSNNTIKLYKEYKETLKRDYDVVLYSLNFDWYNVLKIGRTNWNAESNIILSSSVANLTQIELDAASVLTINSVKANEEDVEFTHQNNLLTFSLPEPLSANDEAIIKINYTYNGDGTRGFELKYDGVVTAHTMSEPRDARYWMPCNDIAIDRAFSELEIKVPNGYIATYNGIMIDSLSTQDTTTLRWENTKFPIPTYLMAVTASKYVTYTDKYVKKDNTILPIDYYVLEKFLNNSVTDRTVSAFNLHTNMMAFFSDFLFEYPYEKYGVVSIPDFGGGMEHNTITTIDNNWIYYYQYSGLAHELAHHWLGNYITCADWQDLWINEGGATWLEAKWNKHYFGNQAFQDVLLQMKDGYLSRGGSQLPPVYDLPETSLFNYDLSYAKAGWVYQMLYAALGEEKFKATLKEIFNKYPLTSITTQQFRDIVKDMNPDYPLSWDKFFEQWLLRPGHPILNLAFTTNEASDNKYITTCLIKQTQTFADVPEVFEMPVFLEYVKPNGDTLTKVHYMNSREQSFTDTLDFEPINYSINRFNFLGQVLDIADVKPGDDIQSTQLYPNIAESASTIKVLINGEINSDIQYRIFSELGESIKSANIQLASSMLNGVFDIKLPQLSRGMYYLQLNLNGASEVHKFIIK